MEPRGWVIGRWGSLGGWEDSGGGGGCLVASTRAGFPGGIEGGRGGKDEGGRNEEGAETFSKDSSRLSPSSVPVPVHSRSMGNACRAPGVVAESSPSEESETEWNDETEEACMWPWARRMPSEGERSLSARGSVEGGMSMLLDGDVVGLAAGAETERGEFNDSFRGGKGGALKNFGGDPSKLMRGALSCGRGVAAGSGEQPGKMAVVGLAPNGPSSMTQSLRSRRDVLCWSELGDAEGE